MVLWCPLPLFLGVCPPTLEAVLLPYHSPPSALPLLEDPSVSEKLLFIQALGSHVAQYTLVRSLCKHILNASADHDRECRDPILPLYSHKEECAEECLPSVQGRGVWGWPTTSISLIMKNAWMASLDILENTGSAEKGRATRAARLSCYDIKTRCT